MFPPFDEATTDSGHDAQRMHACVREPFCSWLQMSFRGRDVFAKLVFCTFFFFLRTLVCVFSLAYLSYMTPLEFERENK